MGLKFNPFTGQIDVTGAAGGSGGGPVVVNALPDSWGQPVPAYVIDSTDPNAIAGFGGGLVMSGADPSVELLVATGDASDATTTSNIEIFTGVGQGDTGTIYVYTGGANYAGKTSGSMYVNTGDGAVTSGSIEIRTGSGLLPTGNSGDITISTGTASGGTRGTLFLQGEVVDMSASPGPLRVPVLAADPGSLTDGDLWYNSTDDKLRIRANGITVDLN